MGEERGGTVFVEIPTAFFGVLATEAVAIRTDLLVSTAIEEVYEIVEK